jgi:hypothetical protein
MKIRSHDNYLTREIEIVRNSKDIIFLAFTESGPSLDDYRYYSRNLTYAEAEKLIDCLKQVMTQEVES